MSHTRNRIKCRKCGAVAVAGGKEYRKWSGELDDIITVEDDGNETTKGEQ
jgi:hypothetical protein